MTRFLVVGSGRSGTTWAQATLRVCGINCTHQTVFTWDTYERGSWDWGSSEGEASFMAVPLLDVIKEREPDTRIVLLRRNFAQSAKSWVTRGAFTDDMPTLYPGWTDAIQRVCPGVFKWDHPLSRALEYVEAWTVHASRYADTTLDIEDIQPVDLFTAVGRLDAFDVVLAGSISTAINSGAP